MNKIRYVLCLVVLSFSHLIFAQLASPVTDNNPRDLLNSAFGPRDKSDSNELYDYDFHEGFDIHNANGQNVNALTYGIVITVQSDDTGWNSYVVIRHTATAYTEGGSEPAFSFLARYQHLVPSVKEGDFVNSNTIIGTSQLNHLHLTYCLNDNQQKEEVKYLSYWTEHSLHTDGLMDQIQPGVNETIIPKFIDKNKVELIPTEVLCLDQDWNDIVQPSSDAQIADTYNGSSKKYFEFGIKINNKKLDLNRIEIELNGVEKETGSSLLTQDLLKDFNDEILVVDFEDRINCGDGNINRSDIGHISKSIGIFPIKFDRPNDQIVYFRCYIDENYWYNTVGEIDLIVKVFEHDKEQDWHFINLKVEGGESLDFPYSYYMDGSSVELGPHSVSFIQDKYKGDTEYPSNLWWVVENKDGTPAVLNTDYEFTEGSATSQKPKINFKTPQEYRVTLYVFGDGSQNMIQKNNYSITTAISQESSNNYLYKKGWDVSVLNENQNYIVIDQPNVMVYRENETYDFYVEKSDKASDPSGFSSLSETHTAGWITNVTISENKKVSVTVDEYLESEFGDYRIGTITLNGDGYIENKIKILQIKKDAPLKIESLGVDVDNYITAGEWLQIDWKTPDGTKYTFEGSGFTEDGILKFSYSIGGDSETKYPILPSELNFSGLDSETKVSGKENEQLKKSVVGTVHWKIPPELSGDGYRIYAELEGDSDINAKSSLFSIKPRKITYVEPLVNKIYNGRDLLIDFVIEGVQKVKIAYKYTSSDWMECNNTEGNPVEINVADGGEFSFLWNVPQSLITPTNYTIKVYDSEYPDEIFDDYNYFAPENWTEIILPEGIREFKAETTIPIKVVSNNSGLVNLRYKIDEGVYNNINNEAGFNVTAFEELSINWTVPNMQQLECEIRNPDDDCTSGKFEVYKIKFIEPDASTVWYANSNKNIKWKTHSNYNVKIEYVENEIATIISDTEGTEAKAIASTTDTENSFNWKIPTALSGDVKLKITGADGVPVESPQFTISNKLKIISPLAGEFIKSDDPVVLVWEYKELTPELWVVEYWGDNGNWAEVESGITEYSDLNSASNFDNSVEGMRKLTFNLPAQNSEVKIRVKHKRSDGSFDGEVEVGNISIRNQAVIYVSENGDGTDPYGGFETGFNSIQTAVDFSKDGFTVLVDDGVYKVNGYISIDNTKGITLKSNNGPNNTIIEFINEVKGTILITNYAQVIVEGFTVTGGHGFEIIKGDYAPSYMGGGFYLHSAQVTIRNCIITKNKDGIYSNGACVIENSLIIENESDGIYAYLYYDNTIWIKNCTIYGNSGYDIYGYYYGSASRQGYLELKNSIVGNLLNSGQYADLKFNVYHSLILTSPESNINIDAYSILGSDPPFVNTADKNFSLSPSSLALNSADPESSTITDMLSNQRVGIPDMGAIEGTYLPKTITLKMPLEETGNGSGLVKYSKGILGEEQKVDLSVETQVEISSPLVFGNINLEAVNPGDGRNFVIWDDGDEKIIKTLNYHTNLTEIFPCYKIPNKSNSTNALLGTNKKVVKGYDGKLHMIYESMGYIWYEISSDGGTNWTMANEGKPMCIANSQYQPVIDASSENGYSVVASFISSRGIRLHLFKNGILKDQKDFLSIAEGTINKIFVQLYGNSIQLYFKYKKQDEYWQRFDNLDVEYNNDQIYENYSTYSVLGSTQDNSILGDMDIVHTHDFDGRIYLAYQSGSTKLSIHSMHTASRSIGSAYSEFDFGNDGSSFFDIKSIKIDLIKVENDIAPVVCVQVGDNNYEYPLYAIYYSNFNHLNHTAQASDTIKICSDVNEYGSFKISGSLSDEKSLRLIWQDYPQTGENDGQIKTVEIRDWQLGDITTISAEKNIKSFDLIPGSSIYNKEAIVFKGVQSPYTIEPYLLSTPELNRALVNGWNWFSLNIQPSDLSLASVFDSFGPTENDYIKSQTQFAQYVSDSEGGWYGSLENLDNLQMYKAKLNLTESKILKLVDDFWIDPSQTPISLSPGWNWISYLPKAPQSVNNALTSGGDFAWTEGDIILGYNNNEVASFDGNSWVGDGQNDVMRPGQGYIIYVNNSSSFNMYYSNSAPSWSGETVLQKKDNIEGWVTNFNNFEHRMPVIANLNIEGEIIETDRLGVFAGTECRGTAKPVKLKSSGKYIFLLSVAGNSEPNEQLEFKYFSSAKAEVFKTNRQIDFNANKVVGALTDPLELTLGGLDEQEIPETYSLNQNYPNPFNPSTVIEYSIPEVSEVKLEVFDVLGRRAALLVNETKQPGYYKAVFDGRNAGGARLSSGIYFFRIVSSKFTDVKKMILLK